MAFITNCLLVLSILFLRIKCDLNNNAITNSKGVIQFTVLDSGKSLQIPNRHNSHKAVVSSDVPKLKFSLHGGSSAEKLTNSSASIWTLKLGDESQVEISVKEHWANFTEYYVVWSGGDDDSREVCFHYGNAKWYNTYQEKQQHWPMNSSIKLSEYAFNSIPQHYSVVEYLFLNSDGFAIMLDKLSPLFLRRDHNNGDSIMCISSQAKAPYLEGKDVPEPSYRNIKFSIYMGVNIRSVYEGAANALGSIPRPGSIPNEHLFTYPSWMLIGGVGNHFPGKDTFTQQSVLDFSKDLQHHGYVHSLLTLDIDWQVNSPYLTFDAKRFPDPPTMVKQLQQSGHSVSLYFHSLVMDHTLSREHPEFFVKDRKTNKELSVNWYEAATVFDFTNRKAVEWLQKKLWDIKTKDHIDAFQFTEYTMGSDQFKFADQYVQKYPSLFVNKYIDVASGFGDRMVVRDGYKSQDLPVFVRITDRTPEWDYEGGLKSVIPTVLALSIGGYSFLMPDLVGGRYGQASEDLFIRYVQVQTFMPAMLFARPPWEYSARCAEITKKFVDLHVAHAPTIVDLARKRVSDGSPIIRPMWYADPEDPQTYSIDSQFMLGDDILVAPVVVPGAHERMVYLPKGVWIDQHGKFFNGPLELRVSAPIEVLPYFKRHIV